MGKLSQKELLDESLSSKLRAVTKPLTKLAAGVGGAVGAISKAGTSAGIGDVIGGVKSGLEKEKQFFKSKKTELDKTIEELGYYKIGKERGKGDTVVVDVADLDYDSSGKQVQGETFGIPLVLKWDKESKSFSVARSPKGRGEEPKPQPEPEERGQGRVNPGTAIAKAYDNQDKLATQQAAKKVPPPSQSALKTQPTKPKLGPAFNKPEDKPEAKKVPPPSQSALQPKANPALGAAFNKPKDKPKSDFFASASKPSADASGKKSNTPKKKKSSDTEDATYRRIKRAIDSRKMPKRKDVELYVNTHGKDAKNVIGGVQLRRLLNNKDKLREKLSQKNLMRQLTLLFK